MPSYFVDLSRRTVFERDALRFQVPNKERADRSLVLLSFLVLYCVPKGIHLLQRGSIRGATLA